ncbi:hypothetical protein GKO46_13120 [SAR202 cluster bacterium JH702]|uniref:Terminase large subunit-like ATPase domain-containing protein n=1 Tax=Candidatus Lucifugimonas marina TaxID=3038979 RepID=A0ABD4XVE9_9CHLR|nr:hypothetical protein [SAR202 cluster bacterium JH702]
MINAQQRSDHQVAEYIADRHEFRKAELTLPDGRSFGSVEEQWQSEHIWKPLDERLEDGQWRYRLVYFELARGHAKSFSGAAEALTTAFFEQNANIYIAAVDKQQAEICFAHLSGMVRRNPRLAGSVDLGRWVATVKATGSTITVLSSDAASSYGLGGTGQAFIVIADELAMWANRDFFDALWSATGKVSMWRFIVLSNAGFDKQGLAWTLREQARTEPWAYLYAPEGIQASWLSSEWVEQMRSTLPPEVFMRLIENKWTEGSGSFITRTMLDTCIDPQWSPQLFGSGRTRYVAALDLGLVHDRTALAVCHMEAGQPTLDYLRVWEGNQAQPVSIEAVEDELLAVSRRFRLRKMFFDPWQLQASMQRLRRKLPVTEFRFTAESVRRLSEALYTAISTGRMRFYPDKELESELLALNAVQKGYGWRVDHSSGSYSDRAMAIGMCLTELLNRPTGSILNAIRFPGDVFRKAPSAANKPKKITIPPTKPERRSRLRCVASTARYFDRNKDRWLTWYFGDTDWIAESQANSLLETGDFELLETKKPKKVQL